MNDTEPLPLIEVSAEDLPIYCPSPQMPSWSAHPRVFLDLTQGETSCPYCGTRYKLCPATAPQRQPV